MADEVKMEFSVRSLKEPYALIWVQSLLNEFFPNPVYREEPFEVVAVEPKKTILEKAFLLHEKFETGFPGAVNDDRQSRHIYDLVRLMDSPAGKEALTDTGLFDALVAHRRHYIRLSGMNYETLHPKTLNFVPTIDLIHLYFEKDYMEMRRSMIYGNTHEFDELIRRLKVFNGRFRLMGTGFTLEQIIEQAISEIPLDINVNIIHQPVEILSADGGENKFVVTFQRLKGEAVFEKIEIVSS